MIARACPSVLLAVSAFVTAPGCFSQEATLGLPCDTARGCGRRQACIDGTCQATGEDPRYCPMQDEVVSLGSDLPAISTELLPTDAIDVLGECGSLGGAQALYLWEPPVSGTFAVRLLADATFFETADVLPPLHLRDGGCEGTLGTCAQAEGGARSFAANREDVIVLAIDNIPEDIDPGSVGFRIAVDYADYCLTGGQLAPTVPIVLQGTTVGSENLIQPATCEGTRGTGFGQDVAFSWTAPREGVFAFTAASSDTELLLYLLSSDCGGTQLACATDRGFSGTASNTLALVRGQSVVVVVDTPSEASSASFQLTIDEAFGCVPTMNDLGFQFPPGGIEVAASKAASSPIITCAPDDAVELLYRWTAPAAAFYTFSTAASDMAVTLSVLEDSCSGTVVGCDEGIVPLDTTTDGNVTLPLDTGESVVLAAAPADTVGTVRLTLEQIPCGAQLLATPLPISEQGSVEPRGQGTAMCEGNRPSPEDAVFSWRAPDDGIYELSVAADDTAVDLSLYVQDGSCAGPTLGCESATAPSMTLELRAQETVAVGIAAPPGPAPIPYTLMIREAP